MFFDSKANLLGKIGETIIRNLLASKHEVTMSEDAMDPKKDMSIENTSIEVKTLTLNYVTNSFFLPDQQLDKCLNVDRLFFVEVPKYTNWPIFVYEKLKPRHGKRHTFKNGTSGRLYPLTEMAFVDIIDDKDLIKRMKELSTSVYHDLTMSTPEAAEERKQLISSLPRSVI